MKRNKVALLAIIVIIIVFGGTAIITYVYNLIYSEMIATAGLLFAAAAFIGVFLTLNATYLQLRKVMAKPRLEVIFTETNSSEYTIYIQNKRESPYYLRLSVINKGNAVTKLFQIDFELLSIFQPSLEPTIGVEIPTAYKGTSTNRRPISDITSMLSFCSEEQVYCFVNRPATIHMIKISTRPDEYNEYPSEFTIKYHVYGDWAETQEGKLKIIINRSGGLP